MSLGAVQQEITQILADADRWANEHFLTLDALEAEDARDQPR